MNGLLYNRFSDYLKNIYGGKVYKLPVNLPVTCPNRDGRLGSSGCAFCGEEGAGFETLSEKFPVLEQLERNADYISNKYNADMFIAYFQNYTNTYMPPDMLEKYLKEACREEVKAIYISTRPDCISSRHAGIMRDISARYKKHIVVELGLQTVNYKALSMLNRGHTLAEFIDAVMILKKHNIGTCAHCIIDLPMDTEEDVVETSKIVSSLHVDQVKCHTLYILEGTELGEQYKLGKLKPLRMEEYMERIILFLEYLDPAAVVQRIISRAPGERTLFCNWGLSWWKIRDMVENKMVREGRYQGRHFNYLGGSCCRFPETGKLY